MKNIKNFPKLYELYKAAKNVEITNLPMFKYDIKKDKIVNGLDHYLENPKDVNFYSCVNTYTEKDAFLLAKKSKKIILLVNENSKDGDYRFVTVEDIASGLLTGEFLKRLDY